MKKVIIILLAVLVPGITGHLIAGDQIELEPFHSINVSSEIIAEIILSEQESLEVDFKNAADENLIYEVVDSVLKVRMKTGNYKSAELKVKINYISNLRNLEAEGRAQIWSKRDLPDTENLTVKLSNGGEMRINLKCDSLSATLSQGSIIHLIGKTRALKVKCTTNATFSGYEFESETAEVSASSTGKVKVKVNKYLKANASTKGFVGYIGEPGKVDEKTSLKGEIIKTILE